MINFFKKFFLNPTHKPFSTVHVNFETPGSRSDFSSDRRVWRLVDALHQANHHPSVHEERDVHIFVVHRSCEQSWLKRAVDSDAIVVFDVDDEFFLSAAESKFVPYIDAADVITVESETARDYFARFHSNVLVQPLHTVEANTWIFTVRSVFEKPKVHFLNPQIRGLLERTDLVVLADRNPEHANRTLRSLYSDHITFNSVGLMHASQNDSYFEELRTKCKTPLQHLGGDVHDFFDIYRELGFYLRNSRGQFILIVAAGVEVFPGFFTQALSNFADDSIVFFPVANPDKRTVIEASQVFGLPEFLASPQLPFLCMLPRLETLKSVELDPQFGPLGLWEFLIRALTQCNLSVSVAPTIQGFVSKELFHSSPCDGYFHYLKEREPNRAKELKSPALEWEELCSILHAQVTQTHETLFQKHMVGILASLSRKLSQLSRRNVYLESRLTKYETLQSAYHESKKTLEHARRDIQTLRERIEKTQSESSPEVYS